MVYTTSLFFNEVDLPLSRELPRIMDHRRLLLRRNIHPAAQREPESVFSHLEDVERIMTNCSSGRVSI